MGDWVVVIRGTGAHHNGKDYDADKMTQDFVHELKRQGHLKVEGTFNFGGCHELDKPLPEFQDFVDKCNEPFPAFENHGLKPMRDPEKNLQSTSIQWNGKNWADVLKFITEDSDMTTYYCDQDCVIQIFTDDVCSFSIRVGHWIFKRPNGHLSLHSHTD